MKKYFLLILLLFVSLSVKIHAKSGFIFGGNVGVIGETKVEGRSATYDNDSSTVPGTDSGVLDLDNDLGFKLQAGLKYDFNNKISLMGLLGYFARTTDKQDGKTGEINSFDLSLMVQIYIWEGFRGRLGVNVPVLGTFTLDIDNSTKSGLHGGKLDSSGVLGYDIGLSYDLMENFFITVGYNISSMVVEEERITEGREYTVKANVTHSQIVVGFDYLLPLGFLN